jgi:transposase
MRKSYDGLAAIARLGHDLLSRDVFLFVSRDRRRAKALFWDGNGLNIWMKRLEQGRFADVIARGEMSVTELQLFFEGSSSVVKNLSAEDLTSRFRA